MTQASANQKSLPAAEQLFTKRFSQPHSSGRAAAGSRHEHSLGRQVRPRQNQPGMASRVTEALGVGANAPTPQATNLQTYQLLKLLSKQRKELLKFVKALVFIVSFSGTS